MAVVVTLVQTKQIRINIHKRDNTKNTVNTNIHITKRVTLYKTRTYTHPHITIKLKQQQYKLQQTIYIIYPHYNQAPSV